MVHIPAEAGNLVIATYRDAKVDDEKRKELKNHIAKEFNCKARDDGNSSESGEDGNKLQPSMKKGGFLVFDFEKGDADGAKRCKKALNKKDPTQEYDWVIHGRKHDRTPCEFAFPRRK